LVIINLILIFIDIILIRCKGCKSTFECHSSWWSFWNIKLFL